MKYADLHIHSIYSTRFYQTNPASLMDKILLDSLLRPKEILKIAQKQNLSAIAVTDHNTLKGSIAAQKIADKYDITVIPGCEISSKVGHILAYGIKKEIPPRLSGPETIRRIHAQGGIAALAHPFDISPKRFLRFRQKRKFVNYHFDAVEVASCITSYSQKAANLAKRLNSAKIAGSDAHCKLAVGFALTAFPDNCQQVADYLKAIKNKKTFATRPNGSRFKIWIHTFFEMWVRNLVSHLENL